MKHSLKFGDPIIAVIGSKRTGTEEILYGKYAGKGWAQGRLCFRLRHPDNKITLHRRAFPRPTTLQQWIWVHEKTYTNKKHTQS